MKNISCNPSGDGDVKIVTNFPPRNEVSVKSRQQINYQNPQQCFC